MALAEVDKLHERVEADDALGVGHEVRKGVDIVVVDFSVSLVDGVLDAAYVEMRGRFSLVARRVSRQPTDESRLEWAGRN
jgi:hypothetical protein